MNTWDAVVDSDQKQKSVTGWFAGNQVVEGGGQVGAVVVACIVTKNATKQ